MPQRLLRYGSPFSERMVKMIIDDILDMMDDLLDSAASVPFSVKKSIIDCDQMRDYINEIRLNLPQEIKQAKLIVRDRQSIMTDGQRGQVHPYQQGGGPEDGQDRGPPRCHPEQAVGAH